MHGLSNPQYLQFDMGTHKYFGCSNSVLFEIDKMVPDKAQN